jgi:hypothetical protein
LQANVLSLSSFPRCRPAKKRKFFQNFCDSQKYKIWKTYKQQKAADACKDNILSLDIYEYEFYIKRTKPRKAT